MKRFIYGWRDYKYFKSFYITLDDRARKELDKLSTKKEMKISNSRFLYALNMAMH